MKSFVFEALKGMLIGIANVIPGVSGGTMMVSMGIYGKLIHSITHLFKEFKRSVLTLLPYLVGMAVAIVGFSFAVEFLFSRFPLPTSAAFVGLILGGLPAILDKARGQKVNAVGVLLFIAFFAGIILLQIFGAGVENEAQIHLSLLEYIKLFLAGVVASATMIIPGVSGSMMLMIMGYYLPVISAVKGLATTLVALDFAAVMGYVGILLPFGIGVLIGIFAIAKLIEILLARFAMATYCAILGLVAASPVVIFLSIGVGDVTVLSIIAAVIALAGGWLLAALLGRKNGATES